METVRTLELVDMYFQLLSMYTLEEVSRIHIKWVTCYHTVKFWVEDRE
jgi:hypothetical protein